MVISLRPVTAGDDDFLMRLYASTRQDEVRAWGWNGAQQAAFLQMQFSAQQRWYGLAYPDAESSLILSGGVPIGRMLVQRAPQAIRLIDIALLPEHRNSGIGTGLMENLLEEAGSAGLPLRLQVLKTNPAARWYQRLGFVITGEDEVYLQMERA